MKKFFCVLVFVFLTEFSFSQDITKLGDLTNIVKVAIVDITTTWNNTNFQVSSGDTVIIICVNESFYLRAIIFPHPATKNCKKGGRLYRIGWCYN
jgi:hypothetical protein